VAERLGVAVGYGLDSSLEKFEKAEPLVTLDGAVVEYAGADIENQEHHIVCRFKWSTVFVAEFIFN
jgi:hypothetical protein